ncbi:IS5 family transposase [Caballeronia mineralivorans]|uniref:IS5 family transposase n=1 Tax=Caballeronia mineralivorans TaxID=2010198 RepID=UPI000B42442A|nr:IS5 family transposase [Caballeronia mineralivorans]
MPKELIDDELWSLIEPLLPKRLPRNRQYAGRKPIADRAVLTGIVFVLRSGIAWNLLPQEMGCGSGTACWRRLVAWQEAGVWERIHETMLAELRRRGELDLTRALVDSSSVRAMPGGKKTGPNPTDRRKLGSKHHLIVDAQGIPLAVILTGANCNDITQLEPLVAAIPAIRGRRGRPLRKPEIVQGDRGYSSEPHRKRLRKRGIKPVLAKIGSPHGSGLGKTRWPVERSIAWLHSFRRLKFRYERYAHVHEAFLSLACALICWTRLKSLIN